MFNWAYWPTRPQTLAKGLSTPIPVAVVHPRPFRSNLAKVAAPAVLRRHPISRQTPAVGEESMNEVPCSGSGSDEEPFLFPPPFFRGCRVYFARQSPDLAVV